MKVVAILSEKGGAGKTTLAVHLATAAHLEGHSVAILDLDPQGSAYAWAERRTEPPEAQAITPVALPGWLDKLRQADCELVVIDTGRDANNAGYTAAKAADMILIPLRPGGFDFLALGRTLDLCKLAGKLPVVVLNALRPGSRRAEADAVDVLKDLECSVAPFVFHDRADYRHASVAARSAQELDPDGKAAEEAANLFSFVRSRIELAIHPLPAKQKKVAP
jgi:chromosome partitioning protein